MFLYTSIFILFDCPVSWHEAHWCHECQGSDQVESVPFGHLISYPRVSFLPWTVSIHEKAVGWTNGHGGEGSNECCADQWIQQPTTWISLVKIPSYDNIHNSHCWHITNKPALPVKPEIVASSQRGFILSLALGNVAWKWSNIACDDGNDNLAGVSTALM